MVASRFWPTENGEKTMKKSLIKNEVVVTVSSESNEPVPNTSTLSHRKFVFIVLLLAAGALAVYLSLGRVAKDDLRTLFDFDETNLEELLFAGKFKEFIEKFDKRHKTREEATYRFQVFTNNVKKIKQANNNGIGQFGINHLTDWTDSELKMLYSPLPENEDEYENRLDEVRQIGRERIDPGVPRPEAFDWRTKNVVTPAKNQGRCGSCWAFAMVAAVESAYAIRNGQLRNLSAQEMVDCDDKNHGCGGGQLDYALLFVKQHGLALEESYPYVASNQTCRSFNATVFVNDGGYLPNDEDKLADYLFQNGPFIIGINVTEELHFYTGDVFSPMDADCKFWAVGAHALAVVGYGKTEDDGIPYWIVKNSWGPTWGTENGYFWLRRGVNACGFTSMPVAPLI